MTFTRLLVPGWGYPASLWKTACGKKGLLWSHGYYEGPQSYILERNYYWIIAHSFGFYMLPKELREKAKGIIWYGSFFEEPPFAQQTYQAYLKNPNDVLQKFIANMFSPHETNTPLPQANYSVILRDLNTLLQFDYKRFWQEEDYIRPKIEYIHGAHDTIVPMVPDAHVLPEEGHMPCHHSREFSKWLDNQLA